MSDQFTTNPLFERVERARRRKRKMRETHITLAHGSGGRAMHDLVEGLFLEYFRNPLLEKLEDQAVFSVNPANKLAFTTDSYVVDPIFFPGGDIGALSVHGTVNDLAMSGARPMYLSAGFILEEGLPIEPLVIAEKHRPHAALAESAQDAIFADPPQILRRFGRTPRRRSVGVDARIFHVRS